MKAPRRDFPGPAIRWRDAVRQALQQQQPLTLLFDYDGTLTPLVRHPSLARLSPAWRDLLRWLGSRPSVRLGFISGRSLAELQTLIGLPNAAYAGSGGQQMNLWGVTRLDPALANWDVVFPVLDQLLQPILQRYPGTWLEPKPGALSLHFRGLWPLMATCLRLDVAQALLGASEIQSRVVSQAIELTLQGAWHKGTAVEAILQQLQTLNTSPGTVIYFGDAPNDREAMEQVHLASGWTVGIGPDAPEIAQERLADPAALLAELQSLIAEHPQAPAVVRSASPPDRAPRSGSRALESGPGVLLVDPDVSFRQKLAGELQALGWVAWQTDQPREAQQILRREAEQIRFLLVDLQLPGFEAGRMLREWTAGQTGFYRAVMSAPVSPHALEAYRRLAAWPLFVKPFTGSELHARFQHWVAQPLAPPQALNPVLSGGA